ncbi:Bifunctional heparan sulfate N-deacetylase/N-sulfotransferase, partial [Fragariocoptes setiger]
LADKAAYLAAFLGALVAVCERRYWSQCYIEVVFPVHEQLYDAWRRVWNVQLTSTEEYPHLRPAHARRGFIHKDIMVLPRQTCGLYTHTIFMDKYPGGMSKLIANIQGGELFQTIVHQPVNIFMTHMSNYANDRLALYTFGSLINFVHKWTNLRLKFASSPLELGHIYFSLHPDEIEPLWVNPCLDKRHMAIWSPFKSCQSLPSFVIVGPQKSGTTALHTFLNLHPNLLTSRPSEENFEEVQFFNDKNYFRGLDWYIDQFASNHSDKSSKTFPIHSTNNITDKSMKKVYFEKSATYFDQPKVPRRMHSLLPNAKIVIVLISPIRRAYSWYQHARAHKDPAALKYSFYRIITADNEAPPRVRDLRDRCLTPGHYANHLNNWLSYYRSDQLIIVDGNWFRDNPAQVLDSLQSSLNIPSILDYTNILTFDKRKGFFCYKTTLSQHSFHADTNMIDTVNRHETNDGKVKVNCLGPGKGRVYPNMDSDSEIFLRRYYLPHNKALLDLLSRLNIDAPLWLNEDLEFV